MSGRDSNGRQRARGTLNSLKNSSGKQLRQQEMHCISVGKRCIESGSYSLPESPSEVCVLPQSCGSQLVGFILKVQL